MKLSQVQKLSIKSFKMNIVLSLKGLEPADRSKKINELTEQEFEIPYSKKKYLSRATIYSWLKEFESADNRDEALLRKERSDSGCWRKLTESQQKALLRWRYENPYRTSSDLLEELLENDLATLDNAPSVSLIVRFLRSKKLDRRTLIRNNLPCGKVRLPYEADYPNQIWLIDTKGQNIEIPDPKNPSQLISAMPIVLIDDFSRFVVGMRYIHMGEENEQMVMSVVMEAISTFGIPDILYTDRGGPYVGNALKKALTVLGCKSLRAPTRDGSAKGKVEKVMQVYFSKVDTELNAKNLCKTLNIKQVNEYAKAITHIYHQTKHRKTGALPYERYLSHPGQFRHYASKKILSLLFLSINMSKVTKDNQIRLNKRSYLMPVVGYECKYVEVRSDITHLEIVYIWFENKFIGVAEEYIPQNDFLVRKKYVDSQSVPQTIEIPEACEVPEYNRLERKLFEYQQIKDDQAYINEELQRLQKQRADTKAQLTKVNYIITSASENGLIESHSQDNQFVNTSSVVENVEKNTLIKSTFTETSLEDSVGEIMKSEGSKTKENTPEINIESEGKSNTQTDSSKDNQVGEISNIEWRADHCVHLLSVLLRRFLSPTDRFAIHRVFSQYGPFKERMVRRVVGRLLGESHPTSDLNAYLEALRIESTRKGAD